MSSIATHTGNVVVVWLVKSLGN